ncbi:hypothetical protein H7I53_18015 [Mycolicibacterium pulveris]|uniref:Uncharacterized protein n=1 Tax=Mycolicibacterium pulveris TaxID=36813 RepID=A0A7I7UFA4_MYCPV|nr:hypothetical protein [Mycolicibacterium pulveris]MCV6982111.1 hypothetical protein [Mycolicibacterium pulveris]BBY78846.1 hypothetical protein MPUL_00040 [Mycolicibacterium pulveris]
MIRVHDTNTGRSAVIAGADDLPEAIRPWYPDALDEVYEVIDRLADNIRNVEPTHEECAYLGIEWEWADDDES